MQPLPHSASSSFTERRPCRSHRPKRISIIVTPRAAASPEFDRVLRHVGMLWPRLRTISRARGVKYFIADADRTTKQSKPKLLPGQQCVSVACLPRFYSLPPRLMPRLRPTRMAGSGIGSGA